MLRLYQFVFNQRPQQIICFTSFDRIFEIIKFFENLIKVSQQQQQQQSHY